MSNSPYLSNQLKQYLRKYQLQAIINSSVNSVLKSQPDDPFSYLIGLFQTHSSPEIQLKSIKAYESINGEGLPCIKLLVTVNYLNQDKQFIVNQSCSIMADDSVQFDGGDRLSGKGLTKCVTLTNEIAMKIQGYKCSGQFQIDKVLENIYQEKGNTSLHSINTLSYSIPKIQSQVLHLPLVSIIQTLNSNSSPLPLSNINLVVHCLHGGKVIGSKCKVFKYMIISKQGCKDPFIAQNILAAVRKAIVGGKGGQAALKFSPDGTFVCPLDTIMDNLKIVQEAINQAGAKDLFGIGLSWAADTLFSPDTKKYELENPKTPFDNDQMIDYLVKLCTDKPAITYLEDPLAATELAAWKKLKTKLNDTEALKHVRIGTKNQKLMPVASHPFSEQNLKKALSNLSIPATADSHPDLTPEQLQTTNSIKFSLDFIQVRQYELKTLSNVMKLSKIMQKTNTRLILQDCLYQSYDNSIIDVSLGAGAMVGLSTINGNKFDRICKLNRIKELAQIFGEKKAENIEIK